MRSFPPVPKLKSRRSSVIRSLDTFYEKAHRLRGENTNKTYRLGDRVEVQVARVDLDRRQIDFALVDVLARARGAGGRGRPAVRPPGRPAGRTSRAPGRAPGRPGAKGPSRGRKRR
jgi:ribonuclease R